MCRHARSSANLLRTAQVPRPWPLRAKVKQGLALQAKGSWLWQKTLGLGYSVFSKSQRGYVLARFDCRETVLGHAPRQHTQAMNLRYGKQNFSTLMQVLTQGIRARPLVLQDFLQCLESDGSPPLSPLLCQARHRILAFKVAFPLDAGLSSFAPDIRACIEAWKRFTASVVTVDLRSASYASSARRLRVFRSLSPEPWQLLGLAGQALKQRRLEMPRQCPGFLASMPGQLKPVLA